MTHITCGLTAKNRDQLQNPTLGDRVWAAFSFMHICIDTIIQKSRTARSDD